MGYPKVKFDFLKEIVDARIANKILAILASDEIVIRTVPFVNGLTNKNLLLTTNKRQLVLRIYSKSSLLLEISRENEAEYIEKLIPFGIVPLVIFQNSDFALVEYIEGVTPADDEITHARFVNSFVKSLRTTHSLNPFGRVFDPVIVLDNYIKRVRSVHIELPQQFNECWLVFQSIKTMLKDNSSSTLCPCHNDLNATNVIFVKDRTVLLDWEYAGLNHPYYDIAKFCAHHSLSYDQSEKIFLTYDSNALGDCKTFHLQRAVAYMWQVSWLLLNYAHDQSKTAFFRAAEQRIKEFINVVQEVKQGGVPAG